MKVAVLGAAGGIGQALALLLKNRLPAGSELSLYDIAPVTPGVAVDLSHIPTDVKVKGFCGEDPSPALVGADVVLISAGVARKPGMDRSDLFNINAGIVKNLVEKCAASCPKALIGIITNPVNTTVAIAAEVLKKAGVNWSAGFAGINKLAAQKNIPVYIITGQADNALEVLHGLHLMRPVFTCDNTTIRTAARVNPTLYILQQGTITGKWSGNNIDKAEKILTGLPDMPPVPAPMKTAPPDSIQQ